MIIYVATNTVNGKQYVGMTTQVFEERVRKHKNKAEKSDLNYHFYKAIRKHGWDVFEWSIIDTAETFEELSEKERSWIAKLDTYKNGYNSTLGGEGTLGFYKTEEERIHLMKTNGVLDIDTVRKIKTDIVKGEHSLKELAEKYSTTYTTLQGISSEQRWGLVEVEGWEGRKRGCRSITNETAALIKKDLVSGKYLHKELAEKYDAPLGTVEDINRGIIYKDIEVEGWDSRKLKRVGIEDELIKLIKEELVKNELTQAQISEKLKVSTKVINQTNREKRGTHIKVDGWENRRVGKGSRKGVSK